jgi:hypothetical protein
MIEGSCHCGAVRWRYDGVPPSATACNCTSCRRYGALWAYGFQGEGVEVSGPTRTYVRGDRLLASHFCGDCGCMAYWTPFEAGADGRRRMGVNLRLAEPAAVAAIPIRHFDGFDTWTEVHRAAACVADMWF